MTVVLLCFQGDLSNTMAVPLLDQVPNLLPGLGVWGPGEDGVHVSMLLAIQHFFIVMTF